MVESVLGKQKVPSFIPEPPVKVLRWKAMGKTRRAAASLIEMNQGPLSVQGSFIYATDGIYDKPVIDGWIPDSIPGITC